MSRTVTTACAVTHSPVRPGLILLVAVYVLFKSCSPPPLFFHSLIVFLCPFSNLLSFGRRVCPCLPFFSMCSFFGDKPRERDFLKTLRLVSGTEACAVEQHGETVDDDKGVCVAPAPPPHPNPFNRLIQSVLWPINSSVGTIPLYDLSFFSLT